MINNTQFETVQDIKSRLLAVDTSCQSLCATLQDAGDIEALQDAIEHLDEAYKALGELA